MARHLRLEHLTFYEQLGEGAHGTVSKVCFEEPYIGKVTAAAKNVRHLRREEIEVLERLNHPNVVGLFGSIQNGPITLIILEYACHGTVRDYVTKNNNQPPKNPLLLKWSREGVSALKYLHEQHVIHRDVKGSNCLLFDDLVLKLSDFGLAREMDNDASMISSSVKGTLVYMAPEIHSKGHYSYQSDMWAYGMLLVEMSSGKLPFHGLEWHTAVFQCTKHNLRPEIAPSCPDYIKNIIHECLQANRKDRPSAETVEKKLQVPNLCSETESVQCQPEPDCQPLTSPTSELPSTSNTHTSTGSFISSRDEQKPSETSSQGKGAGNQQVDIQPLSKSLCRKLQMFESDLTPTFICRSFRSSSMPRGHMFPPPILQNHLTEPSLSYPNLIRNESESDTDMEQRLFPDTCRGATDDSELIRPSSTPNLSSIEWLDSSVQSSAFSCGTLQISTETLDNMSGLPKNSYKLPRTVSVPALNGTNTETMFDSIYHSCVSGRACMRHNSFLSVVTQTHTTGTQTSSNPCDDFGSVISINRHTNSTSLLQLSRSSPEGEEIRLATFAATSLPCLANYDVIDEEADDIIQPSFSPLSDLGPSGEMNDHPHEARSELCLVAAEEKPKSQCSKCCPICVVL